jgi:hypothetical protein
MRTLLTICLLFVAMPARAIVWDNDTITGIIQDVTDVKEEVLHGNIHDSATDLARQLGDLQTNGAFVKDVAPTVLKLLQDRRQPISDFAGPAFDCAAATPCANFRTRLHDFGDDFVALADRLPMLAKAGVGDAGRFTTIVDRTPPFLLFFLKEALDVVPEWDAVPADLAEIYDEVDDRDAFTSDWTPARHRSRASETTGRAAADTFCAKKADRVTNPTFDKVALNRWKAGITTLKLVVGAVAEFIPEEVGGSILGEGLSNVKIPLQAVIKAIASAVEVSGTFLDTYQANLEVCRARIAATEQHSRDVETNLANCTGLNVYRTSIGNDEAYALLTAMLTDAEANAQNVGAARSQLRIVDNYRGQKRWGLAYKFMCKSYARIGDGP